MQITEGMYNGNGATGKYIEFTNLGVSAVDFTGWSFDDSSRAPGSTHNLGRSDEINFCSASAALVDHLTCGDAAGGNAALASTAWASIGSSVGNVGTEGISFDARDGSFVSVKQDSPQAVLAGPLHFAAGGGSSTMTPLLDAGARLGLASLSDVQTLSPVDRWIGTPAAGNLLILSLDPRRLNEIDRSGQLLSSLDLAGVTTQAIEGLTIDEQGVIYLVAEDSGTANSRLFVLTSPVPEPGTVALMLAGLGLMAGRSRQKGKSETKGTSTGSLTSF